MVHTFQPALRKIYPFDQYTLLWMKGGNGLFQIDFQNYQFTGEKIIFLSPGQYFQLLHGKLDIRRVNLMPRAISHTFDTRFLFKHIVSLGHIDLQFADQNLLNTCPMENMPGFMHEVLQHAVRLWLGQNPFRSTAPELELIFDLKDIIDRKAKAFITVPEIISELPKPSPKINALVKNKLNLTVNKLLQDKLILEARREVAFTDKTTKEIAFDLGFNDPTYFNRFFKSKTAKTPGEFRDHFGYEPEDAFVPELLSLIDEHFKDQHTSSFYADTMCMSIKTLAKKSKEKLDVTVGELIREKLIAEAKQLLLQDLPVREVAFELGFEEANHFTAYFKKYTSSTPTEFRLISQKVHSS